MANPRGKSAALAQPPARRGRADSRLWRVVNSAALLGLAYLLAMPANSYRQAQFVPPYERLLEYSWMSDMHSQLVAGRWAGRDFIYTYGPLRQLLHSGGALVGSGDLASRLRFDRAIVTALGVAGVWWLLKTTNASWGWRAVLLLAWFGCDYELHTKPLAAILIAAMFARSLATVERPPRWWQRGLAVLAWSSAAPLAMLYCFDLGIVISVWLPLFVGVVLIASRGESYPAISMLRSRAVLMLASALTGAIVFVGVLRSTSGWKDYLSDSWHVARGYLTQLAAPLSNPDAFFIAAFGMIALGTLFFSIRRFRAQGRIEHANQAAALEQIAVACLALIWLRYGLTRSDSLHVVDALLPMIFLWGCLVPAAWLAAARESRPAQKRWQASAAFALPALVLLKVAIAPEAASTSWSERWQAFSRPAPASTSIVMDDATQRAVAAARALPGEALVIWPNESFIAQAAGKVNPTYTLQSFMAMTPALEQATIDRYDRLGDTPVLLVRLGGDLDSVSHISRAPALFRYLIENFETSTGSNPEFAILERSGRPRQWQLHQVELPGGNMIADLAAAEFVTIPLDSTHVDVRASDLLLLDVSTTKVPPNPIGKSAKVLIKLTLDSGEHRFRFVPLAQDGQPHRVGISYLQPTDDLFLETFFGPNTVQAAERVTKIEIAWQSIDFLTPLADEIIVHQFEFLRREGTPEKTVPVSEASRWRAER